MRSYFAYAGLEIRCSAARSAGVAFGAVTQDQNGAAVVSTVELGSPASRAGLSAQDEILAVDGVRVTARSIGEVMAAKKPGASVRVLVAHRRTVREIEFAPGPRNERSFRIRSVADPSPLQVAILGAMLSGPAVGSQPDRLARTPGTATAVAARSASCPPPGPWSKKARSAPYSAAGTTARIQQAAPLATTR